MLFVACLVWGTFALVGLFIARDKGLSSFGGAVAGFLLGPIGWLVLYLVPDDRGICPECRGRIPRKARRCMHCGVAVPTAAVWRDVGE